MDLFVFCKRILGSYLYFSIVLWFVDVTDKCVSHCNPDIDNTDLSAIMSASGLSDGTRTD